MNQRIDNLKELIRYSSSITATIPASVFTGEYFKQQQEAYAELKKDNELEVTETKITRQISENEIYMERVIHISMKGE